MLMDTETCLNEEHLHDEKIIFEIPKEKDTTTVVLKKYEDKKEIKQDESKIQNKTTIGIVAGIILTVLLIGILYLSGFFEYISKPQTQFIPDVSYKTVEEAKINLLELGFVVKTNIIYESSETIENGNVIRTIPSAESEVEIGSEITLVVSKGKSYIIENYVGKNIDNIKKILEDMNVIVSFTEIQSDEPVGTIISQKGLYEGDTIYPYNSTCRIDFTVSGKKEFVMIDVIGYHYEEAKKMIEEKGGVVEFVVLNTANITEEELQSIKIGHIVAQTPDSGTYYIQDEENVITLTYYEQSDNN